MQTMKRLPQQPAFDQAVEVLLITVCFAASVYGLEILTAYNVLS